MIRWIGAALALLAIGAGIGFLVGPSDEGDVDEETLDGDGFELSYPADWDPQRPSLPGMQDPASAPAEVSAVGRDAISYIATRRVEPPGETPVSEANVMAFAPSFRRDFEELVAATPAPARIIGSPTPLSVGGLPALRLALEYNHSTGFEVRYDATQVFGSESAYVIACQYPPPRAREFGAACERALETFREAE
jgi:hypothetical protein